MSRRRSGLSKHTRAYCYSCGNPPKYPQLKTDDLLIHFEANDITSYPGTGTVWKNIGTGGSTYDATFLGSPNPIFVNSTVKSFQFTRHPLNNGTDYLSYNCMSFTRPSQLSDDFTYCAWIKTTNVGVGLNHYQLMYIVSTETGDLNNDFGFGIDVNGYLTYGDGKTGASDITIRTSTQVNTGLWTFVAVSRAKITGQICLYINGILDTIGTCNIGNTLSTASFVLIGAETDFPGATFGGNIGTILANTSVLTDEEILTNYYATSRYYQ
jgi:hypothetical protein